MLGQTLDDFEWVMVDDGSTDRTAALLADLASTDRRVRVLAPGRVGRARALNLAVEAAQCDYVANLDFDDASRPDRLRLQVAFLDAHPEVGVLGGRYLVLNERRGERFVRMPPERHKQIATAMASRIPFCHSVVMFRRAAWREAGGYPLVDKLIDFRLWIAIGSRGWQFACLPEILGEHFVYSESYFHRTFAYRASSASLPGPRRSRSRPSTCRSGPGSTRGAAWFTGRCQTASSGWPGEFWLARGNKTSRTVDRRQHCPKSYPIAAAGKDAGISARLKFDGRAMEGLTCGQTGPRLAARFKDVEAPVSTGKARASRVGLCGTQPPTSLARQVRR